VLAGRGAANDARLLHKRTHDSSSCKLHLARAFRRYFHVSPSEYISRCRIWRARELLATSRLALADIAIEVGFSDQSHLTNAFRRETAMTPAAYRRLDRT